MNRGFDPVSNIFKQHVTGEGTALVKQDEDAASTKKAEKRDIVGPQEQFPGCLILIVSLLKSDSIFASEAAAGLLRDISGVSLYRDAVAESGAIERIAGLLICCLANCDDHVLEHCIYTLWNLSVDEKHRAKIADSELLPLMVKCMSKEDMRVKEAVFKKDSLAEAKCFPVLEIFGKDVLKEAQCPRLAACDCCQQRPQCL